jgi:hypothetical protein
MVAYLAKGFIEICALAVWAVEIPIGFNAKDHPYDSQTTFNKRNG